MSNRPELNVASAPTAARAVERNQVVGDGPFDEHGVGRAIGDTGGAGQVEVDRRHASAREVAHVERIGVADRFEPSDRSRVRLKKPSSLNNSIRSLPLDPSNRSASLPAPAMNRVVPVTGDPREQVVAVAEKRAGIAAARVLEIVAGACVDHLEPGGAQQRVVAVAAAQVHARQRAGRLVGAEVIVAAKAADVDRQNIA
jgi:hypothetical protein